MIQEDSVSVIYLIKKAYSGLSQEHLLSEIFQEDDISYLSNKGAK
jgi:hypothetical protein